jgi:chromosome segregation protein
VAAGTEEQRRSREAVDSLGREFAVLSGERSEAVAKARELESRRRELAADIASVQEELARPGLSAELAGRDMAELRRRLAELDGREAELLRIRDEQRAANAEIAGELARLRAGSEELRREERDRQVQIARLRDGLAELDRRETEIRLRLENILAKAGEELGLKPEDLEERPPDASPEEAARPDPGAEWAGLSDADLLARIEDLSQKIRNIGNVNFAAIDELAELEAGAEFLRVQKEELAAAAAAIRAAVEDINAKSSTLFQSTFEAVRVNFQQIFASLFGGGRADLLLEESAEPGADPLDAGIEIRAQPPGKEPKSISLLSGGEKALCAVSLLFALFRSKPSPFCILDEVDGPLDEANIDRFMRQIRVFAADTQFIVITHSQLTMGMTDAIWGVTQRVAGISNVLSLKYDDMDKIGRERSSAALARREGSGPEPEDQAGIAYAGASLPAGDRLLAPA